MRYMSQSPEGAAPGFDFVVGMWDSSVDMSQSPEGAAPGFDILRAASSTSAQVSLSPEGAAPGFDTGTGTPFGAPERVSIPRRGGAWFRR